MGTGRSKSGSPRTETQSKYEQAISLFSAEELSEIKLVFQRICSINGNSETEKTVFNEEDLKQYIAGRVPDKVTSKLFLILCTNGESQSVSSADFIIAVADLTKGMVEQQAHVLYTLVVDEDKTFTLSSFREVLLVFLECYDVILRSMQVNWKAANTAATSVFVDMVMQDLQDGDIGSAMDLSNWLLNKPLIQNILTDTMHYCFLIQHSAVKEEVGSSDTAVAYTSPMLPTFTDVNWAQFKSILNLPSLLLINHQLPHGVRLPWRLLYSIDAHGESFSTLVKKISLQGPSVLIVRDNGGHVFGGFASVSWHVGPNFVGCSQCFLFTLSPSMAVFESSSINDHYMYLNMDQETLPNGLGMGGQFGYFGFWLDQDFGKGHSKCHPKCTTYESPQLSATEQFTVDVLEVWAVGEIPKVNDEDGDQSGSILDKNPEAKALLDIIGKERKSEGLREDPEADIPEVHQLPPL